ncbi:MAG: virulence factor TspB C-terminal domain-related protein [Comamonas sp.]
MPGTDPDADDKCPTGTYKSGGKCYPNEEVKKPTDSAGNCPTGYTKKGDACIGNKPLPDSDKGKDFCKENPTLDSCKTGSFVGSCTANFKCEGDAVQCAMAREQHIRNCQLFETATQESQLYDSIKDLKGDQTGNLDGAQTIDIGSLINTSDALGGGSCISDINVTVMKSTISLPMSRVCPYMGMLGNILVAVSMLLAARIITRG